MKKRETPGMNQQGGFTLIELSIVLVIIGLIVGGVLVGQDMIKAAQIRATVGQLEKYNTAVNTFRGKYNGVPGDLLSGVTYFASVAGQSATTAGEGNGDGLVQSVGVGPAVCATLNCQAGENILFWYELAQANMIPDAIGTAAGNFTYTTLTSAMSSSFLPNAKVAGSIAVQAASGLNYWVLANIGGGANVNGIPPSITNSLTPLQAYQIDTKVDDGLPASGLVQSITGSVPGTAANLTTAAAMSATACGTTLADTNVYALTTLNGNNNANLVNCQLGIRTNF